MMIINNGDEFENGAAEPHQMTEIEETYKMAMCLGWQLSSAGKE